MTETNAMEQEKPTLTAMIETVRKLKREGYKVQREYKIHPDDFAALRKQVQVEPHMVEIEPNRPAEIFGLRVVLDYSAERLPTKMPNQE